MARFGDATTSDQPFATLQDASDAMSQDIMNALAQAKQNAPVKLVRVGFFGFCVLSDRLPFWARALAAIFVWMEWQSMTVVPVGTDGAPAVDDSAASATVDTTAMPAVQPATPGS